MQILVTGGAGFIGSHIVDACCNAGHTVSILDDLSTGRRENLNSKAAFFEGDLRDTDLVTRILRDKKIEVVCHQAAQVDVRRSVADPVFDASVNVLGALTLFESALRQGVRRVVFASSGGAIYGEQDYFPADERHPTRPISPYGIAKLVTEQYLYYYHVIGGMHVVNLRYANVYGPRQNPEGEAGVVAIFAGRMLKGEQPVINGDGKQTRDYVYVGDVVRANLLALDREGWNIYNVGTGIESDVNLIFSTIRRFTGAACQERHGEAKKGEQLRSVLDAGHIGRELGWKPTTVLEEGLRLTVEHFRATLGHAR
jgi:UDP-glucose 4-epimerase